MRQNAAWSGNGLIREGELLYLRAVVWEGICLGGQLSGRAFVNTSTSVGERRQLLRKNISKLPLSPQCFPKLSISTS